MINYRHAVGIEPGEIIEARTVDGLASMIVQSVANTNFALYASIDKIDFFLLTNYPSGTKTLYWERPYPWLAIYLWTTSAPPEIGIGSIEAQLGDTFTASRISFNWHDRVF